MAEITGNPQIEGPFVDDIEDILHQRFRIDEMAIVTIIRRCDIDFLSR